ncbi:hypothetical protein HDU97_001891 [Phlyctochytrium planicorne]|nr:hypothetical protein HDU97_001891 [Phlyctochytrium planicorne]
MQPKHLLSALALLCTSSSLVHASEIDLATEQHELERRGGDASKTLGFIGGILGVIGGILTFNPELITFGSVLTVVGGATATLGEAISRRDDEFESSLGAALIADEPNLSIHSAEVHSSGNWTNYVLSGRNLTAGNAVYMELTHYPQTGRIDGLVVGSKTGLSKRAAKNAQHIKFSFHVFSKPKGGYDKAQLNRFASNMAKSVAAKKTDTSCHGAIVKGQGAWNGKIVIGTLEQLKKKKVVNDCSKDPKAYGEYFNEKHVPNKGKAGNSFLAV